MLRKITVLFFSLTILALIAEIHAQPKTENVIVVTWDGYRWQEFFGGADEFLINSKGASGTADLEGTKEKYWRDTPTERRELLTPFIWNVIAKQGQIFGDPSKNAPARVTNGMNFSYPGYNEIFCGFGDPAIDSNSKVNNANMSVLEFLDKMPAYKGKVAAICTWDVFPYILRSSENGIPVFSGWTILDDAKLGEHGQRVNEMVKNLPHYWPGNTFDLLSIEATREYLPKTKPRVFFLGLGETDEWGHARRYDLYLGAAQNGDRYLQELWSWLQSDPQYKNKTTLILTTDHGRGKNPADWTSHGEDVEDAEYMWIAVMGPDTPALGVRENIETTQAQVAATIAALLGEDFNAASPKSAKPLPVFAER